MAGSRKGLEFLASIGAAESRLKEASAEPATIHPPRAGFVGKALSESNASLDSRLAEAERTAAEQTALAESLKSKLESGAVAIKVDPKRVRPSAYADRHPCAFSGAEFEDFVGEIKATGGNSEPGIVRPISGDPAFDYELAAGHRRHRACLVAALPYFTFVRELTDEELLVSMATENRGRKDLSAFELGRHYSRLLTDNVFSSARSMSRALNISSSALDRLTRFGDLHEEIIGAFEDPRAIRLQWIDKLIASYNRDREAFLAEVQSIRSKPDTHPSEVFKRLAKVNSQHSIVASNKMVLASTRMIHDRPALVLYKGAPDELMQKLKALVVEYHKEHEQDGTDTP